MSLGPENVNDKYSFSDYFEADSGDGGQDDHDLDFKYFLDQIHYFEEVSNDNFKICKGVKDSLAKHIKFWESIGANTFIIDTIGYGIT